jgi:phenylalanine-4-hydroxylase
MRHKLRGGQIKVGFYWLKTCENPTMIFLKDLTSKEFLKHIKALKLENNRIIDQGNIEKEFVNHYKLVQSQGIITKEKKFVYGNMC